MRNININKQECAAEQGIFDVPCRVVHIVSSFLGENITDATQSTRQGWEEQFQAMAEAGDDILLDAEALTLTTWEEDDWTW